MLPLSTVMLVRDEATGDRVPVLKAGNSLQADLEKLKQAGVKGVMVDVWWGIVEGAGPGRYNFAPYLELFDMAARTGLEVQAVLSFHSAGLNVGDDVSIPLPGWVLEVGRENPDVFYTDRQGYRNTEVLSLGVDRFPLFRGRTPVEMYSDFASAFLKEAHRVLGTVVTELTVGLGPAGERRYPSYPEGDGRWRFPGVGEFQCYDAYMLADLQQKATRAGHPEWGRGGPHDAGTYTSEPWDTGFFADCGSYSTEYGDFFLSWYSGLLIDHADRILSAIDVVLRTHNTGCLLCKGEDGDKSIIRDTPKVQLGLKLAGVHWYYRTASHAAELTGGYYNTRFRDGYGPIMTMLKKHNVAVNFTAVEMRDCETPANAYCSPEKLFTQLKLASSKLGMPLAGENALQRYDRFAFNQIEECVYGDKCAEEAAKADAGDPSLDKLTFLRMSGDMFEHWEEFQGFVHRMKQRDTMLP